MSPTDTGMNASQGSTGHPTLKVAAVARRLGVAPATLRTWARRYGLGPSAHVAGSHRQYSSEDLARLVVMRRLTLEGVAPAEAARVAVTTEVDRPVTSPGVASARRWGSGRLRWGGGDGGRGDDSASATAAEIDETGPAPDVASGNETDGIRSATRHLEEVARRRYVAKSAALLDAARALDSYACAGHIGHLISEHGAAEAWQHVLAPTLSVTGRHWRDTGEWVEVEHVLSDVITAELHRASPVVTGDAGVLLACADDEQHALPLHALAAALAERGVGTRVLGGRVPSRALTSAVARTSPKVVVVLAVMPTGGTQQLAALRSLVSPRSGTQLFAAGPGWEGLQLPEGVGRLPTLADALARLERHLASVR